jgi:hypothetical protein
LQQASSLRDVGRRAVGAQEASCRRPTNGLPQASAQRQPQAYAQRLPKAYAQRLPKA